MTAIEKNDLKEAIREVIREDKMFLKELIQEVLTTSVVQEKAPGQESSQAEQFDAIIKKDFERYKNVFKALA